MTEQASTFRHLGQKGREFLGLEVITLSAVTKNSIEVVTFNSNELTSYCPVTGQPDIYEVLIVVAPVDTTLETKSLKLYLEQYREKAMFAEDLAGQVVQDIFDALDPAWVRVTLTQNIRGGIQLKVKVCRFFDEYEGLNEEDNYVE